MADHTNKGTSFPSPPVDVHNLEFLPEGDTGGMDLSTLPPIGAPIVISHVIDVPAPTEEALLAEAAALGVSVEEVIVARLSRDSAA